MSHESRALPDKSGVLRIRSPAPKKMSGEGEDKRCLPPAVEETHLRSLHLETRQHRLGRSAPLQEVALQSPPSSPRSSSLGAARRSEDWPARLVWRLAEPRCECARFVSARSVRQNAPEATHSPVESLLHCPVRVAVEHAPRTTRYHRGLESG